MKAYRVFRLVIPGCLLLVGLPPAQAGEISKQPILTIDPGRHTDTITRIDADKSGRWLVSASEDKTVRVWDAATGRLERVLRPPIGEGHEGELYAVAISPDGNLVACGGWTQDGTPGFVIYIFSRADGRLLGTIQGLPNTIGHLAFSPDGSMLAAALEGGGLRIYSPEQRSDRGRGDSASVTLPLLAEDANYSALSDWAAFSPDSRRLATTAEDGYVRLYDLRPLAGESKHTRNIAPVARQKLPGSNRPHSVAFSPDGLKLAVGFHHAPAVNVLSVSDLHLLFAPDTRAVNNGDLSSVQWSSDGRYLLGAGLFAASSHVPILRWPANGQGPAAAIVSGATNSIMDMVPLATGDLAVCAAGSTLAVLKLDGTRKWLVGPSGADFRSGQLWLSRDGAIVSFGYALGDGNAATFSVANRALVTGAAAASGRTSLFLTPPIRSAPGLAVSGWQNTSTPTLNGRPLTLKPFESSLSLAVAPDQKSFLLGTGWYVRRFGKDGKEIWGRSVPGPAWAVNISANGAMAVAACGDGIIRWYRYADGKELASFFPLSDRLRWVIWTPSGYYDASPGGEELIGWQVNNGSDRAADFYPASRFRDLRYRPGVISKIFGTQDETSAVRMADAEQGRASETVSITERLPPVITITSPEDGAKISATTVTLHYSVRLPNGEPVTGIRAMVDGRPVATDRGVKLVEDAAGGPSISVPIPIKNCEVSLIADNRFSASVPAAIHLIWSPAAPTTEFVAKPVLYLLAVGISAYQNPAYKLEFAAKDAKDFANAMQAQKGGLYRDVQVKLLTDAVKDDIEDGLDWLQHQVTSVDVGVIFLAGHGLDDSNGVYYFLPANADVNRLKATCLVFSDLKNTVSVLAGKVLMFVDTCHSGDVLGARRGFPDINAFVNELASAESGVVVFTASTGQQYSLEDPRWQNGAFTKALVEGVDGKADYGGKGEITVNMLDLYLAERVKELTNGQQTPATAKPSTVPDFPLALLRQQAYAVAKPAAELLLAR